MTYHQFQPPGGEPHGSFETFYFNDDYGSSLDDSQDLAPGWYWQACFPGCMPDGDPVGPFVTEEDAINDASEAAA